VFTVIIAVVEMMAVGKASSIGWYVTGLYIATTVMAAFFGTMSTLMFRGLYSTENFPASSPPYIQLGCTMDGYLLAENDDGSVTCSADYLSDDPNVNWVIDDVSKTFTKSSGGPTSVSLSDTIYSGIFQKIVPSNIIESFADGNFTAVIFFAVLFGVALARVVANTKGKSSYMIGFLKEADFVLQTVLLWIIFVTPFAVCSLIATAIGKQDDLATMFKNIGYLVAASMVGWGFQFFFTYLGFFYFMTKTNPFGYLKHIVPAMTMAFASASSAATIPTTLLSVKSTGRVPDTIGRFVIPFGATVNMDGGAGKYLVSSLRVFSTCFRNFMFLTFVISFFQSTLLAPLFG
jgi:Na+/H+-dicarboxylate symporter